MRRSILQRLAVLTVLVGVVALANSSLAAESQVVQAQFTLARGSVFEIIVQHSITSPQFSWVLSRDGTFVEAKRDQLFRSRLIEAGSYSLNAEISGANSAERFRSVIRINVPAADRNPSLTNASPDALVITDPPIDPKGRILTSGGQEIIQITSADKAIAKFSLDIDSEKDSNNDSDATNDNDAAGTYFAGNATPIIVWLTEPRSDHTLTLQATFKDGKQETQRIRLVDNRTAQQEDAVDRKVSKISLSDLHDGMYAFSAEFPEELSYPALFQWNFGDGNLSLLDAPIHTYMQNGSYTIRLTVRNLKTGEVSSEVSETLKVTNAPVHPLTPDDEEPEDDKGKGSLLWLLLKVVLVGGIAVLFGVVVVFLISKLRRGSSLQEKLEVAEQKISGEETEEDALPPMELIEDAEVVTEEEKAPPKKVPAKSEPKPAVRGHEGPSGPERKVIHEPKPAVRSPEQEVIHEPKPAVRSPEQEVIPEPKPAVRGPELEVASKPPTPKPETKPQPQQERAPEPKRDPQPEKPKEGANGSLPPWLQPSEERVEPPKAQETKQETPKPPSAQPSAPTQQDTPKPKTIAESGPAPDWLQSKSKEPVKTPLEPSAQTPHTTEPKQQPQPQSQPKQQSQPQYQPKQQPQPQSQPKQQPQPQSQSKPTTPTPHPAPEPGPEGPVPEWLQTGNNQKPAPQEAPNQKTPQDNDEPVAFLRAESVEEEQKQQEDKKDQNT